MTTPTETTQIPQFKADDLHIEELAAHLLEVSLEELAGEDGEYESDSGIRFTTGSASR